MLGGVCIIYPADPLGVMPSGIDTFIDGLIRWAPPDVELRLIGITSDASKRRVGRWNACALGDRKFEFYPMFAFSPSDRRPLIPVTVRFMFALLTARPAFESAILEFHRIEPALLFLRDQRPKTCFIHQNMAELHNEHSDIRWKFAPRIYFALESFLVKRFSRLFCVREDAVDAYRTSYPAFPERFQFTPTWVDPQLFSPASAPAKNALRTTLAASVGFASSDTLLISVGRLDQQKDPLLLLQAFGRLRQKDPSLRLIIVGDGVLRPDVTRLIEQQDLSQAVALAGLRPKSEIADWLRAADLFVLSSAYEGMPMAVLEALGSGLPVAATDVGEVRRVVQPGVNGEIAQNRTAEDLAEAIGKSLARREDYAGQPCLNSVRAYSPAIVVDEIYSIYRQLQQS